MWSRYELYGQLDDYRKRGTRNVEEDRWQGVDSEQHHTRERSSNARFRFDGRSVNEPVAGYASRKGPKRFVTPGATSPCDGLMTQLLTQPKDLAISLDPHSDLPIHILISSSLSIRSHWTALSLPRWSCTSLFISALFPSHPDMSR